MRFVSVRDLRGQPTKVWRELKQRGELVITSNGKPIAILTSASEDTFEDSLAAIRAARAQRASWQRTVAVVGRSRRVRPVP